MVQENCFLISHHYDYCGDSPFQAEERGREGWMRWSTISPSKDAYHATGDVALNVTAGSRIGVYFPHCLSRCA